MIHSINITTSLISLINLGMKKGANQLSWIEEILLEFHHTQIISLRLTAVKIEVVLFQRYYAVRLYNTITGYVKSSLNFLNTFSSN